MSRHLAKSHGLQNRIKKIMQLNDDVGKVAAASTHVVGMCWYRSIVVYYVVLYSCIGV